MLNRKTTFVLGAGASVDCDKRAFPTGDELQKRIADLLRVEDSGLKLADERMWNALVPRFQAAGNWADEARRLGRAAQRICRGMPAAGSIDNFLHTHQNDPDVVFLGKLAIAQAVLEAESRSHIASSFQTKSEVLAHADMQSSWYGPFIRMLTMGTISDDPRSFAKNLKFVVFNYDRCLEIILIQALQAYYGLDQQSAMALVEEMDIVHPYGSLGQLAPSPAGVPFGHRHADLVSVAEGIRTFTESAEEAIVAQARSYLSEAETLVLLGFGFLPQNMDLLSPGDDREVTRIHATTCGFSPSDKLVLKEQLKRFYAPATRADVGEIQHVHIGSTRTGFIDVENGTCRELIDNHRMRLAA